MNVNEIILKIMTYEGVYTDAELSKVLGLKPSAISNWKSLGSVPKKYLRKYESIISGLAPTSTPGQPVRQESEQQMEFNKMTTRGDYGYYMQEERLHRCNLETGIVYIEMKGVWVEKSTL